jgi:hypothetical protein
MKIKLIFYITLFLVVLGAGWSAYYFYGAPLASKLKIENISIKDLPNNQRYYTDKEPMDIDGQDLTADTYQNSYSYMFTGHEDIYNPVTSSRTILELIDSYNKTKNPFYLEKAELYTQEFLKSSTTHRNALFATYHFDYTIGGTTNTLKKPWYSGMAQGRALSFLSQLYVITAKKEYKTSADKYFRGLELTRQPNDNIWVSMINKDGYFWIEEYPLNKPELVLNGFLYATFGLYDYYETFKTPESKAYLQATLTTAKHEIPKFRRPGKVSKYGLKRGSYNPTYHKTVITQMRYIYSFTGDEFFRTTANTFEEDYK